MALLDFIPVIGDIINAGASHYENVRSQHFQREMMHDQMDWAEKMNEQQQEWQESMWNKNNQYNSPIAQLSRAKAAGINPNAVFGSNGSSVAATMPQQPQIPSAPGGMSAPGFPSLFGGLSQDMRESILLGKQRELLDAQIKNIQSNTKSTDADVERKNMENGVWLQGWNVDMAAKAANVHLTKTQQESVQYQVDVLFPQQEEMNEAELNNLLGAAVKLHEEVKTIQKQQGLIDEQIKTQKAEQGLIGAQTEAQNASADVSRKTAKSIDYQNKVDKAKADIAEQYGVDISQLDAIEGINVQLSAAGNSPEQIEKFWEATRGELGERFKSALYKAVDDPIGTVGKVVGVGGKAKVLRKAVPSTSSRVNPRSSNTSNIKPKRRVTTYYE